MYAISGGGKRNKISNAIKLCYTNIKSLGIKTLTPKILQADKTPKKENVQLIPISRTGAFQGKFEETTVRSQLRNITKSINIATYNIPDDYYPKH